MAKFLPPVLLKLTSQNEGVRKKVRRLITLDLWAVMVSQQGMSFTLPVKPKCTF